jgi:hypothetical protein
VPGLPVRAGDDLSNAAFFCASRFPRIYGEFGDDRRLCRAAEIVRERIGLAFDLALALFATKEKVDDRAILFL